MKQAGKRWVLVAALLILAGAMNQTRFTRHHAATPWPTRMDTAPATPTLNLLLGGFRGVVADWLWLRAMILQEQGRFVEIVQLAEWITALQPQFTDIWSLHAWNLAYNIPVLLPDAQERWRWVRHGYEILRDRALPATRFHPRVCTELAWILMHKIGGTTDDFADVYFVKWLHLYTPLLDERGRFPLDPARQAAFVAEAGLPLHVVHAFEGGYGSHDWRHPLTHAAAWAYAGFSLPPERTGSVMAERLFLQIYRQLFFQGQIVEDPATRDILLRPDFTRLTGLRQIIEKRQQRNDAHTESEMLAATLERITQTLVAYGKQAEAEQTYADLSRLFSEFPAVRHGFDALAAQPISITPRHIPQPEICP